jgi:23S rRNA pseudouridine1911/1915/1917 synthase
VLAALDAGLSRSLAARLARQGEILRDGRPLRPSDTVREGDRLIYEVPETEEVDPAPEAIPLTVVYQDRDLVVVDKPAGMVVHPAIGHATGTLVQALLGLGGPWSTVGGTARPGIVHRLDKGTSGLILAARTDAAHRALAAQLADRTLSRTYLAIVRGGLAQDSALLEGPIARHPRDRLRMAVVEGGRAARTRVEVVERRGGHTLVRCDLETGRTHQIRVHLAALGHPIAGDDLYARPRPGDPTRPMLHAWRLRFVHPRTGEAIELEAPPPADFTDFWARLARPPGSGMG